MRTAMLVMCGFGAFVVAAISSIIILQYIFRLANYLLKVLP